MSTIEPIAPASQAHELLYLLDLFSTSQSLNKIDLDENAELDGLNPPTYLHAVKKCVHNAPYICIPPNDGRPGRLYQSCCNDWLCPRCGELRAKHEYGRMVVGARQLAQDHQLYMMTITLPGNLALETAEAEYLERTNRLHANINYRAKKDGLARHYAAVTERQRRGHPHTHYLTTFCPADAYLITANYERYTQDVQHINANIPHEMRYSPEPLKDIDQRQMFSVWLSLASVKAGLGVQCRMAIADVIEGASRYMAAYLFKVTIFKQWPPRWKRVRYSNNWPKMPAGDATSAFPVLTGVDWHAVASLSGTIEIYSHDVYEHALQWGCPNVVCLG